jgi:hypothetical protein
MGQFCSGVHLSKGCSSNASLLDALEAAHHTNPDAALVFQVDVLPFEKPCECVRVAQSLQIPDNSG